MLPTKLYLAVSVLFVFRDGIALEEPIFKINYLNEIKSNKLNENTNYNYDASKNEEFTIYMPPNDLISFHNNRTVPKESFKDANFSLESEELTLEETIALYQKGYLLNMSSVEEYNVTIERYFARYNNTVVRVGYGKHFLKIFLSPLTQLTRSISEDIEINILKKWEVFQQTQDLTTAFGSALQTPTSGLICLACNIAMKALKIVPSTFKPAVINFFASLFKIVCEVVTTGIVCDRLVDINKDAITHIIRNIPNHELQDRVCSVLLQTGTGTCNNNQVLMKGLLSNITKVPIDIENKFQSVTVSHNVIKFAHFTDIHYDKEYKVGKLGLCKGALCCREDTHLYENLGRSSYSDYLAGEYGYVGQCDSPLKLIDYAMNVSAQKSPKFIYYTGDTPAHDIWLTSEYANTDIIRVIIDRFKKYFPSTPVYPVLGNHDIHPVDLYAPNYTIPAYSSQWLYDLAAIEWPKIIFPSGLAQPSQAELTEIQRTIKLGGYYSVKPPDTHNFRVIGLNNAVCYKYNWWLWADPKGVFGDQFQWLVDTLKKAEDNLEYVHILYHLPPQGSDCFSGWNNEFHRIVDRYSHLIKGQFCGHTHYEELRLFLDSNEKPISILLNGGSLTTYNVVRPNFRIGYIDPMGFIKDYESYTLPLDVRVTEWKLQEKFVDVFNVPDIQPSSVEKAYRDMITNDILKLKYFKMKFKHTTNWLNLTCGNTCLRATVEEIHLKYPLNWK